MPNDPPFLTTDGELALDTTPGGGVLSDTRRLPTRWFRIVSGSNPYKATELWVNEATGAVADYSEGYQSPTGSGSVGYLWEITGNAGVPVGARVPAHPNPHGPGFVFRYSAEDGWWHMGGGAPLTGPVYDPGPFGGLGWNYGGYVLGPTTAQPVAVLTQPGYYKIWVGYHGWLAPISNGFQYANVSNSWAELRVGFAAGIDGELGSYRVCAATHMGVWSYIPSPATSFIQQISCPGAGGGVLLAAANVVTVPHEISIKYGVVSLTDAFLGGNPAGTGLGSWAADLRLTGFIAERVSAVYRETPLATWFALGASNPSPPTGSVAGRPRAVDDSYTVYAGSAISISAPGVLLNDDVPIGYFPVLDTLPTYGTVIFYSSGAFDYKQDQDISGQRLPLIDSFTYHLANAAGTVSNVGMVTITILDPGLDPGPTRNRLTSTIVDVDMGVTSPPPGPETGGGTG